MLIEKLFNIKNTETSSVSEIAQIYPPLKLSGEDSIKFTLSEIILLMPSTEKTSEPYILDIVNLLFSLDKTL